MLLEIRKDPDPILREKTVKVKDPLAPEIQELILNMVETMKHAQGVGLAAPQVGQSLRLCIIEVEGTLYVLINPKITAKSKNKVILEEGCLSFPGIFLPISRASQVQVRYLDQTGKPQKIKADGLLSQALQHEIDHLDGVLFIDRLKKSKIKKKCHAELVSASAYFN
ncbi:MAG: peptide deformylase [Candidatus Moranbacteria bacterium]|nr:peptide deformylase [Candidatus Moranbacteria bacterium]